MEIKIDPRSMYIALVSILETVFREMLEREETFRETLQRMKELKPQISENDGALPDVRLGSEVFGDISSIVVNSFRLAKRTEKDKQSSELKEFFGDVSPVQKIESKKAFGAFVSEVQEGFAEGKSEISGLSGISGELQR